MNSNDLNIIHMDGNVAFEHIGDAFRIELLVKNVEYLLNDGNNWILV